MNFTYSFTCRRSVRITTGASRALRSAALSSVSSPVAYWSRKASSLPEQRVVDERGQPEQLHQVVLERRGGEQQLRAAAQRAPERLAGAVVLAVGVPQPVRLVDDGDVPGDALHLARAHRGERVGADHDPAGVEGVGLEPVPLALADHVAVDHLGLEAELAAELLAPLRAQRGRDQDGRARLPLGGELGQHQPRLDGLAEPDLVGEQAPPVGSAASAKAAASIWCGFRSTAEWASAGVRRLDPPPRAVSASAAIRW